MTSLSSLLQKERNLTLLSSTMDCGTTLNMTEMKMESFSDQISPLSMNTIPQKRSPDLTLQSPSKKVTILTELFATHQLIQQHKARRPYTINPILLTLSLLTPSLPSFQDNCIALTILRRNNLGLSIPCPPPLPLLQQLSQQPLLPLPLHQPQPQILT